MILTNKVMSWIMIALLYAVMLGTGMEEHRRVEVLLALILMHLIASQEDIRDMWKGRKP